MTAAIIGYTGFVGSQLARQHPFRGLFNSKNVEQIAGCDFELLAVSAMPAAKWLANRDPAADRATLDRLVGCLRRVSARQAILISTVDVYPNPVGVDEESPVAGPDSQPYGLHRRLLEEEMQARFPRCLIVRLPGLFGEGLKKNAIYDLLHDNETHKIHHRSTFQFYNLEHLWRDIGVALHRGLSLVNFATEPVMIADVAQEAFGIAFKNDPGTPPARYDMRSRYAECYGGRNGYLVDRNAVLRDLRDFVARERSKA